MKTLFHVTVNCPTVHIGHKIMCFKSNQTLFSNLYKYKHVIHDEIYILEKRMEKNLNNL